MQALVFPSKSSYLLKCSVVYWICLLIPAFLGLSDPFVIVELCPHHLFPMARSQRTQVKLKTLHPVFDELFYLWVSQQMLTWPLAINFESQHLKQHFDSIFSITAMSALSSTGTGVPVWPSLWWTMIGCPLMISLARLCPHWVTSVGRAGRVPHLLERPFNPSSSTCPAKNQAVW